MLRDAGGRVTGQGARQRARVRVVAVRAPPDGRGGVVAAAGQQKGGGATVAMAPPPESSVRVDGAWWG